MLLLLQAALGFAYANVGEWIMHKYILHGLGKNRQSFWAYHLYGHHTVSSQNNMLDIGYKSLNLSLWNAQTKEVLVLLLIVLAHSPIFAVAPVFTGALYLSLMTYYYKHRKAHLNPVWAKRHLRWHYEHHFGVAGNANWCVTWPWFDYLMGTRVRYPQLEDNTGRLNEKQEP